MDTDEGRTTLTNQSSTPHGYPEPHGFPPGFRDDPGRSREGHAPHPIDGPGTSTGGFPIYAFRESLRGAEPEEGYPATPDYGKPSEPDGAAEDFGGSGLLGKHRNAFVVWLGLPLITLGVYLFVWIYRTNRELGEYDRRIKVNPTMSVLAFTLGWLVVVPPFVAAWRLGARTRAAQHAAGIPETNPVLAFVLFLIGFGPLFLQLEINRLWDRYPGAVEGQQVPLYR